MTHKVQAVNRTAEPTTQIGSRRVEPAGPTPSPDPEVVTSGLAVLGLEELKQAWAEFRADER